MRTRWNEDGTAAEIWDEGLGDWRAMSEAEAEQHRIHKLVPTSDVPPAPSQRIIEHDDAYLQALVRQRWNLTTEDGRQALRIAKAYAELMFKRHCR